MTGGFLSPGAEKIAQLLFPSKGHALPAGIPKSLFHINPANFFKRGEHFGKRCV